MTFIKKNCSTKLTGIKRQCKELVHPINSYLLVYELATRLIGQVAAEDKLDMIVKVSPSILFLEIARKDNNKGLNSTDLVSSDED